MFSFPNQKRKIASLDETADSSSKLESNNATEFSYPSSSYREKENVAIDNRRISNETLPYCSLNETHQNDSSVNSDNGAIEMKELHSHDDISKQEINRKVPAAGDPGKNSKVNTDGRLVGKGGMTTQDVSSERNKLPCSFQNERRSAESDEEDDLQALNLGDQIAGGGEDKVDHHEAKKQEYKWRQGEVREGCVPMEMAIGGIMLGSVVLAKNEIEASESGSDLDLESSNQEVSDEKAGDDYDKIEHDLVVEDGIEESFALCWIVLAENELHNEMKKQANWKHVRDGGASEGDERNGDLNQQGNNIVANDLNDENLGENIGEDEENKDQVIIEIDTPGNDVPERAEGNEMPNNGPSRYLRRYYDMMYYLRVCAYKPLHTTDLQKQSWPLSFVLQVAFWSLAITSAFQIICLIKTSFLSLCLSGGYGNSADFAFHSAWLLTMAYAVYIFYFKKAKAQKMLESMMKYEQVYYDDENNTENNNGSTWKLRLINVVAIITIILAITRAFFGTGISDIEKLVLTSSTELAGNLFMWSSKDMNITAQLKTDYGENITLTSIIMGSVVIARDAVCYLQAGMIYDFIVVLALILYNYVHEFMKKVKEVTGNFTLENVNEPSRAELQPGREVVWKQYRQLKIVVKAINKIFGPLFKLMHAGNLLLHAFFFTFIIYGDHPWCVILLFSVNLIKAQVFYVVAVKIAEQYDGIRTWIRNWASRGKIRVGDVEFDAGMILDELDKQPIGLGTRKFFIHETFHCKLLALIGSVFFSMADDETD